MEIRWKGSLILKKNVNFVKKFLEVTLVAKIERNEIILIIDRVLIVGPSF